jgi:hypothetical protein
MNSVPVHPLLEGVQIICDRYRSLPQRSGLFEEMYKRIRENWNRHREADRWPTPEKNWVLRVAPEFTKHPTQHLEKQLQKQIAICLEHEGWGNDVPTASGLVNAHSRQMNVDLAHRIADGFEFIELKIKSDTPYCAACQVLRYGAIYMLYRLEPELARRFKGNSMMCAKRIALEVLAPQPYYACEDVDLRCLEMQLDHEVETFARRKAGVVMSFRFMAFGPDFNYQSGMDCELIRNAVRGRVSPFSPNAANPVQIKGYAGELIRSFGDWEKHALPPERKERQWKEGRSEFELGRSWTARGEPTLPCELMDLLDSHEGTRRIVILSGITQHETTLPFGTHGPRCHDLVLRGEQDGRAVTVCIEAKADESFGGKVTEELRNARKRPVTKFPERLDWLTRWWLGLPAFKDEQFLVLSDVVGNLPYQLLSAIGGTLLEARLQRAYKAVFMVHEFRTMSTVDAKLDDNAKALNGFLHLLLSTNHGRVDELELASGHIVGPITITDRPVAAMKVSYDIPLFVGKIRTDRLA